MCEHTYTRINRIRANTHTGGNEYRTYARYRHACTYNLFHLQLAPSLCLTSSAEGRSQHQHRCGRCRRHSATTWHAPAAEDLRFEESGSGVRGTALASGLTLSRIGRPGAWLAKGSEKPCEDKCDCSLDLVRHGFARTRLFEKSRCKTRM